MHQDEKAFLTYHNENGNRVGEMHTTFRVASSNHHNFRLSLFPFSHPGLTTKGNERVEVVRVKNPKRVYIEPLHHSYI
jgi:hypothetical protein